MHELREHDQMFSGSNITPWHKLGNVVEGRLTAADAIEAAGLDWTVGLAPAFAQLPLFTPGPRDNTAQGIQTPDGLLVPVPDRFHTFREDIGLVLGSVGDRYTPVQNADLFGFLDAIVDSGEAHYETAGSLKNGRIVWMLLRPDENEINLSGDPMKKYLLATTAHDGSAAVRVRPVICRVVCNNTLTYALSEVSTQFSARHTASATERVAEARGALDISFAYFDEFEADAQRLIDTQVELDRFNAIVETLVPISDEQANEGGRSLTMANTKRAGIRHAYASAQVGDFKGTGWGVVQAVNGYELWGQSTHGDRHERQALNAISGRAPLTHKARELVLA